MSSNWNNYCSKFQVCFFFSGFPGLTCPCKMWMCWSVKETHSHLHHRDWVPFCPPDVAICHYFNVAGAKGPVT